MIYFTAEEIYLSILHSIIYGTGFALALSAVDCIIRLAGRSREYFSSLFHYEKIFSVSSVKAKEISISSIGRIRLLIYIITFSVGYILLSYFSLDGIFRLYTLVLSLLIMYFTKLTLGAAAVKLFDKLLFVLLYPIVVVLRIVIRPFRKIFIKIREKPLASAIYPRFHLTK